MNPTLALLLAPLVAGFVAAVWIFRGERELRLAAGILLLPALGLRHGLSATPLADSLLELSASPYASKLALEFAINLLAALAVVTLGRTLRERNRAEIVQWDSMEGVRTLGEILATRRGALDAGLRDLVELGCHRFGLEYGVHARIEGGHYSVVTVRAPDAAAIKAGDVFDLSETLCQRTVENAAPLAIERLSDTPWEPTAANERLRFEAYLGAPVLADGNVVGTLYFASQRPRSVRFTGVEKQLLMLMTDWVGSQIERETLAVAAATPVAAPLAPASHVPSEPGNQRLLLRRDDSIDRRRLNVNAAIAHLEPELRGGLHANRELSLSLDSEHPVARLNRHEFDRVLWSLFWHSIDATPEAGAIRVSTAATEVPPGADPSVQRFILLTLSGEGPGVDAVGLARLFDDAPSDGPIASASGRISLPRAERLLRAQGGDLSVHSDPVRGTTLTAYLPIAEAPVAESTPDL